MAKIVGDSKAIALLASAKPGDPRFLTSKQILDELPDEYEALVSFVYYDVAKDFDEVADKKVMPKKELYRDLAEARGVEGSKEYVLEPIYMEVDYNRLLCKPIEAPPYLMKIHCGFRAIKWGQMLKDDGTFGLTPPGAVDFNAWQRCVKEWSNEEAKTNGYDKSTAKKTSDGSSYWEISWYDSKESKTKTAKIFPKYDTAYKRRNHLDEMLKFDQRQADTKAWHTAIRHACGMPTGYDRTQLTDGYFVLAKIRRSAEAVKLDAMARRQAMANGVSDNARAAQKALFGPGDDAPKSEPAIEVAGTVEDDDDPFVTKSKPVHVDTPREKLITTLKWYIEKNVLAGENLEAVQAALKWLEADEVAEANTKWWDKAISRLKKIEATMPADVRLTQHGLY